MESRLEVVIIRSGGLEWTGDLISWVCFFQIKDMALKASGAYRHCKPCAGSSAGAASGRHHPYHHRRGSGGFRDSETASGSGRFHYAYRRAAGGGGGGGSSGDATPSMSARTDFLAGDEEESDDMSSGAGGCGKEDNAKEWVAQVEPGVLITVVSLPQGGNDLKRIRFRCVLSRHCAYF